MTHILNLVKKAQKGNEKAFLKLFQVYEAEVYRMAYIYVKNKEDALDVMQEVAYQSFKKIHTLKEPQYFKTWLMKIAINCALNVTNKNKKVVHLRPDYEDFIGSYDEDVSLSLSLQNLLDSLTEDEKSVVLLRFYQDYSFKEISELLHIPLGTAKSVLYRALNRLRKQVKGVDCNGS